MFTEGVNERLETQGVKFFDFRFKWLKPIKHRDLKSNLLLIKFEIIRLISNYIK